MSGTSQSLQSITKRYKKVNKTRRGGSAKRVTNTSACAGLHKVLAMEDT